jgi:hypothetical protein
VEGRYYTLKPRAFARQLNVSSLQVLIYVDLQVGDR